MDENRAREIFREEFIKIFHSDKLYFSRDVEIAEGRKIQVGKNTGSSIGTETTQKLSVYGVTPVVQAGTITSPNTQGVAYNQTDANTLKTSIDAIILAIKNFGITA